METIINKESGLGDNSSTIAFQCVDAIQISLFIEKEGLDFYEKSARSVLEPNVKAIFLHLADEEREHIRILQAKLQFLKPAISGKGNTKQKANSFISEELEGKIFPASDNNFLKKFKNDLEALEYGIESEKRSIKILNDLLANERKLDVRSIFAHLVVEEKKHLLLLEELKAKILPGG
tara:strand:- start:604 stop:1137 length:534 start_codon:yes stop_codon:yes gene_type:complete